MTPLTLRIWLAGPLQSWGTSSRFETRGTELAPSKSGVIGMLCAALGRGRDKPVDDLASMRFGVRVERPGAVLRDYHTVGAADDAGVAVASGTRGRGIQTERFYLQDAAFVAGLESADAALLTELLQALIAPRWLLSLGRRSCPPAGPVVNNEAIFDGPLEKALAQPWCPLPTHQPQLLELGEDIELLLEDADGSIETQDQPCGAAFQERAFRARRVQSVRVAPDRSA